MQTITIPDESSQDSQVNAPLNQFCGFLERGAACLADKGWSTEASHFHKWLSELRAKDLRRHGDAVRLQH